MNRSAELQLGAVRRAPDAPTWRSALQARGSRSQWLEGDANRAAGDGNLAGGSGRLPFPLVASGVSRITSIPEPPIPGGPRIKFEPTNVGCYGLIGGVVRVTHRRRKPTAGLSSRPRWRARGAGGTPALHWVIRPLMKTGLLCF